MTPSKHLTLAELRRCMEKVEADARSAGAGPIADQWADGFRVLYEAAKEAAK